MSKLIHRKSPRIDDVPWKPWLGGFADRPIADEDGKMVSPVRPKRRNRQRNKKKRGGKSSAQTWAFRYEAKMAPSRTHPDEHSRWYRTAESADKSQKGSWDSYRERTGNSGNGPQGDVGALK